eukprot:1139990-Pelagomonas_calceolata.AAC.2
MNIRKVNAEKQPVHIQGVSGHGMSRHVMAASLSQPDTFIMLAANQFDLRPSTSMTSWRPCNSIDSLAKMSEEGVSFCKSSCWVWLSCILHTLKEKKNY